MFSRSLGKPPCTDRICTFIREVSLCKDNPASIPVIYCIILRDNAVLFLLLPVLIRIFKWVDHQKFLLLLFLSYFFPTSFHTYFFQVFINMVLLFLFFA